jgi:hypothetical protein
MTRTELLTAVLAPEGWYCVVGLKKSGYPKQVFADTLTGVDTETENLLIQGFDVYFACAKYEESGSRANDNVKSIKSLWLDIDCGANKPYADQAEGLTALQSFCKDVGLPKPWIVNSGRGLHVYWPFTDAVAKADWLPLAKRLKELCVEKQFETDPSRTADAASILRMPGTLNHKNEPPLDVNVIATGKEHSIENYRNILGVIEQTPEHLPSFADSLTRALMGNKQYRFASIVEKNADGSGCPQLVDAIANQATLDEPRWRAALSIAVHCVDADTAIHDISKQHPDYTANATVEKAQKIKGPYTCKSWDATNPGVCIHCSHYNSISSPIILGVEIAKASPEDNIIHYNADSVTKPVSYTVPEYPFPYFRGKNGGVYRKDDDDEDAKAVLVYEHDLYVVKRLKDPERGEVIWLRLHTPKDGVREFALPAADLLTSDRLREVLAWHGVVALKKQMDSIMAYIVRFVKDLQYREGAEIMRTQFGWTEKNKSFIIGSTEITAEGDRYSPPSSYTDKLVEWMAPAGSLEEWKNVINSYDKPGFEPHAFGFFTAFGAPLLSHFKGLHGCIVNLMNNESGTGKTTTIKAMYSVYGHPEELMLIQRDTLNIKLNRLGAMNNLPIGCDEITRMKPDEFSDFAYAVSQGRGRDRMRADANKERLNFARWGTMMLCSSNASVVDKLKALKATPDGELMRVIEYQIPSTKLITKEEADALYPKLYSNYGHAGRIYIRDLVCNLEERLAEVIEVQRVIDRRLNFTGRQRYWSGAIACNFTGALFARRLGLIDIDIGRVFRWALQRFSTMRDDIKPPASSHASVIGEYWNENRNNTLVINGEADKRTGAEILPILEPRNELAIRMEPDTQKLFLTSKKFRAWCATHQITVDDVLDSLKADGVYTGEVKKRMGKGTKTGASPPVDAFVFDCSKGDFIDHDAYVQIAVADAVADADEPSNADKQPEL